MSLFKQIPSIFAKYYSIDGLSSQIVIVKDGLSLHIIVVKDSHLLQQCQSNNHLYVSYVLLVLTVPRLM